VLNTEVPSVGSSYTNDAPLSIWQLIATDSNYTILAELVKVRNDISKYFSISCRYAGTFTFQAAQLVNFFNDTSSSLTMMMPVNSAWSGFMEEINSNLDQLIVSNETLQQLLLYHVHEGFLPCENLLPGTVSTRQQIQLYMFF
jgi:uncharacterized surface protein with fasciclin (FAS1) repeats